MSGIKLAHEVLTTLFVIGHVMDLCLRLWVDKKQTQNKLVCVVTSVELVNKIVSPSPADICVQMCVIVHHWVRHKVTVSELLIKSHLLIFLFGIFVIFAYRMAFEACIALDYWIVKVRLIADLSLTLLSTACTDWIFYWTDNRTRLQVKHGFRWSNNA